ncbi:General transcription factor 2-related zinc finger protein [Arabidopsis thaliana]|uniref:General transcription factor 2-related zinc finger protein n=1 Tax=Arabidopsis thaliana TaxID=3702 RepID=F4J920_ARATH|nr:General transcription factor 2-related zinc finger protein [Arabidopsis thaliana]AEE77674.1 General transcription factor 2-related zinc finger protein [Arabidopsis thaliana]|eukprot:NP_001154658.1 General transcription factor 2-related zinc finger protein [Arabidopsis thaliana]
MRDNAGKCIRSDAFITDGFCRWNNFKSFPEHVGGVDSFHNNVVMKCENLTKQGLAFRGHYKSENSANKGNFVELLKLNIKKGRGQGYDGEIGASCKRKDLIREKHRKKILEGIINGEISTRTWLNQEISLQRPGYTRWNSHYITLLRLTKMYFSIIKKFDDHFNEVNTELLICAASLSPIDAFYEFDHSKLVRLSKFYQVDFSLGEFISIEKELSIYIDTVRNDERFSNLKNLGDIAQKVVETRKHLSYPFGYRLLKLVLILHVATATVERCFSAMKIRSPVLNYQGDDFSGEAMESKEKKRSSVYRNGIE